ncbi:GTP-binding protein yptV3 [Pleodorina starrii]|uniref:GTP-binding protein yptV3 n=1 Tax=Pleodorina starrii TaxID=330485 RepID=A0A9W6EZ16_9CHLO|nr:GTP-binding protein yptV3 [Pleodorina starrii]GLC49651.1 GTP-binding protein yptV3 [Pleodorina starrii]GLC65590.1 GTP-binding protein yptV3 [Pleodorina starrii]
MAVELQPTESAIDFTLKILLLGDSGVGKTSLLTRFAHDNFDEQVASTIGVDFAVKKLSVYDKRVKLTVWDTAGQEKFRTLTTTFYRGAKGIIMVYDVSRPDTLLHLEEQWMRELELHGTEADAVRMVVANKVDVGDARRVSWHEGSDFARRHGCLFAETSAKTNIAVANAFEELVLKILETPSLLEDAGLRSGTVLLDSPQSGYGVYDYCYC